MICPWQKQCVPEVLVKGSSVGHENRHEKQVTTDSGHLESWSAEIPWIYWVCCSTDQQVCTWSVKFWDGSVRLIFLAYRVEKMRMSWSSSENFVGPDETPGSSISNTRQVQLRHRVGQVQRLGCSNLDIGLGLFRYLFGMDMTLGGSSINIESV